ncbi:MAG: hypothetical protein ABIE74_12910 [Pseudomonadota bacterium]
MNPRRDLINLIWNKPLNILISSKPCQLAFGEVAGIEFSRKLRKLYIKVKSQLSML